MRRGQAGAIPRIKDTETRPVTTVRLRNMTHWPLEWRPEDAEPYSPRRTLNPGETIEIPTAEWQALRTSPNSARMIETWLRDGWLEIEPPQCASAGNAEPAERGDDVNQTAIASPTTSILANPPLSREPSPFLADSRLQTPRVKEKAKLAGIARARMVQMVKKELAIIRPDLFSRNDIEALRARYPDFVVFEVCAQHPNLVDALENLQSTKQYVWLAIKIAAAKLGLADSTIESAWRRFKKFMPPDPG